MRLLTIVVAVAVLASLLTLPALAQGPCGCYMPPELLTEPPTPTVTPFATLAPPPLPDKPVRPPIYLPMVIGL